MSGEKLGMQFCRGSWHGALQSAWSAVCRRRTCCLALAPSAGRNCWAIRSVLDELTICYRTSRFRRPKTISHGDAIAVSCASSRHSRRGREADVLMYPASLSARAFSIAKLFAPSCTLHVASPRREVITPGNGRFVAGISSNSECHRAHSTRSGKQRKIVWY